MASFKLPCPSCENQVLITNPELIGTKVECPKCKYRFKAEEPSGGAPKEEAKDEKGKPKDKKEKKDKKPAVATTGDGKKKKSKKLVAIVVGGLAVVVLGVVGFAMMGGDKKPTPPKGGGGPAPIGPLAQNGGGGGGSPDGTGDGTGDGKDKVDPKDKKGQDTKGGKNGKEEPIEPGRKQFPPSDKDDQATTNLLPGQTEALFRFDYGKLSQTPLAMLVDPVMKDMFQRSFGFRITDIATYYHALVGQAREPFGLIHLRHPVAAVELLPPEVLAETPKVIKKRSLFTIKVNPFISGVGNAMAFRAILGDFLRAFPAATGGDQRPVGLCIYDSQHVLVGDSKQLEAFLSDLDDKGYPKFSAVAAEKPLYRSIDYQLKNKLIQVGSESGNSPAIIYAARYVPGQLDLKHLKSDYSQVGVVMEPVLSRATHLAAALHVFNSRQLNATIRLFMDSESSAVDAVKEHLTPGLTGAALALSFFLNNYVEFHDLADGPGPPGGFPPFGPGGYTPGGMMPPGSSFSPGTSPPGPGGKRPPSASGFGPPMGSPPGGMFPPGPGGMYPPGPGGMFPPGPGGMYPPGPGGGLQPGTGFPPGDSSQLLPSTLGLGSTDKVVTISVDLNWSDDTYRRIIAPRLMGITSTIKGKMAVFASELSYYALSSAVPRMLAATKQFPRGTADRKLLDFSRMGLHYKPETRVSFFAELLPFINPARARQSIGLNRDLAWFDEKNLHVAEEWIPELLVPHYPQSAWRSHWPDLPGRVFGGTNYVAIAGKGLDAARYDPAKQAKQVGITGYDWGSRIEEVTDGLANTIYLMQSPPGLPQPWLAGGGATIRGLNEADPMQGFRHTNGTPDGKPGTFALMGDGSVRFIPGDIDPKLLLAMATRAGGEDIASRLDKEAPLIYSPNKKKETELRGDRKGSDSRVVEPKKSTPKGKGVPAGTKPDSAPGPREKK